MRDLGERYKRKYNEGGHRYKGLLIGRWRRMVKAFCQKTAHGANINGLW
jgi:hypothetical protein